MSAMSLISTSFGLLLQLAFRAGEDPAPAISRIEALPETIRIHVASVPGERVRIGELRPHEPLLPGARIVPVWEGAFTADTVSIARFKDARDRLFSRFVLLSKTGEAGVGPSHWVDDCAQIGSRAQPFAVPRSVKGLQCIVDVEDALRLGISHAAHNINLPALFAGGEGSDAERIDVDGIKLPVSSSELRRLDETFGRLTAAGIRNYAILLNYVPARTEAGNPWIHPATDLAHAPNHLGAFNLTTESGYLHYRAAIELLCERYSRPGAPYGALEGLIIGNEIQAHWWWHNLGLAEPSQVVADYQRACRVAALAAAKHHAGIQVFISMDHHWAQPMDPDPRKFIPGRPFLDAFAARARAEGDFPWCVAFHPYPENLFQPRFWDDRDATQSFDTPKITFKNLEVLAAYLAQPQFFRNDGKRRPIILSEQGFHGPDGRPTEDLQAAAYAFAWERVRRIPEIEAFIYHRHVDHPNEGGLQLGLWTAPPAAQGRAKRIREVFESAGTERWDATTSFAKEIVGARDWGEARRRGAFRSVSASSSTKGFEPSGAVDGRRFSATSGAAWRGEAGKAPWTLTLELPARQRVGSILQVLGDDLELFQNAPRKYIWQSSRDGVEWRDLAETRMDHERRLFRTHRLRDAGDLVAVRMVILESEGDAPVVREVEIYPEIDSKIEFPDWVVAVATDEKRNIGDASAFLRLARSLGGESTLSAQRVWLDSFDPAFVQAEPRPLCAFLTGNYADWCQRTREPWRGTQEISAKGNLPIWAACGGAQGLAILSEHGVDSEWDCPHCRDPKNPKTPIYGHIGHTASKPCGDYSACLREQGPTRIRQIGKDPVFDGLPDELTSMESHCGQIEWAPKEWRLIATAGEEAKTRVQCIRREDRPVYAAQFHMEMEGAPESSGKLMANFLKISREWRTSKKE